ncbi:MAG TPA: recombination mediator RecR [Thermomicrobiales bacterium]|nr:recombination mediator RecR [Thermomicrobiales bacterium]
MSVPITPGPVARLIEEFGRLPGVGPKTASRLTFFMLRSPREQAVALAEAILEVKERVRLCSVCFNITETDPCAICASHDRDRAQICVVEEPLDILALERTGEYKGLYHVLHGAISPVDGVGPEQLRIKELQARVERDLPAGGEVILATNHDVPGNATAMYLARQLIPAGVKVTRLASGLPVGGDLEYADEVTLGRALAGRREL